jgi:hypothetical protein
MITTKITINGRGHIGTALSLAKPIPSIFISRPVWLDAASLVAAFRWLVAICWAATLLITWSLWQIRETPPMLPALPLPRIDMGVVLLIGLSVVIIKPKLGVPLFTIFLVYAMLIDQVRLQPEFVSLTFLLWGTLPQPGAQFIGRSHLISMWCWAGINKLLSPAFISSGGPELMRTLLPFAPDWLLSNGGYIIALSEFAIGLLAIFPRTRKIAALLAFGVHMSILLILSPLGQDWNEAVWPWNIALAFAGIALIAPWKESLLQTFRLNRLAIRLIVIFILIAPLGFYFGMMDAYLAHNLYSSNVPRASRTPPTMRLFNVPFPPEQRLFEQNFQLTCEVGDTLSIRDQRWWYRQQGLDTRTVKCNRFEANVSK